jgi:pimeloyl-ACP methyl ester carboxylesterase
MICRRTARRPMSPLPETTAVAVVCAALWWSGRHVTSAAVRRWRPGTGRSRSAGRLQVRTFGSGDPVVVLLHGMLADGNCFGSGFDRLGTGSTVVVPDLLGFGSSAAQPGPFTAADHCAALDEMLDDLALGDRPLVVVGHSMGAGLAVRWAATRTPQVQAVITFCAALYRTGAEADEGVRRMGVVEAILAGDGPLPRTLCAWMCRFRTTASWVAVAIRPDLPVALARSGVHHRWDSYRGSLKSLVRNAEWEPALRRLADAGVTVTLAEGARDPVPVSGRATTLAASLRGVAWAQHPGAGHQLPITDGPWCAAVIAGATAAGGAAMPTAPWTTPGLLPPRT